RPGPPPPDRAGSRAMTGKGGPSCVRLLLLGIALPAALVYTRCTALAQPTEPIREAWRRPLPGVQCLAISPDGSRVAVVSWTGEVQQLCYDARGALAAVTANPARLAVFAPDGRVLWQTAAPVGQEFRLGTPPRGDAGPMGVLTIAAEVPAEPRDSGDSSGRWA